MVSYTIGGIESFKESTLRNHIEAFTKMVQFAEVTADERITSKTGSPIGSELYYIQRIRYLNEKLLIFDINRFLKSCIPGLTKEIAENSICKYIEIN